MFLRKRLIIGLFILSALLGIVRITRVNATTDNLEVKLWFTTSVWGEKKEPAEFLPGETIYLKYSVTGYKTQNNQYSLWHGFVITDKNGKEIISSRKEKAQNQRDYFNGVYSDSYQISLPKDLSSGDYNYVLTLKDIIGHEETSQKGVLTLGSYSKFTITNERFSYTKECTNEIPPLFETGDFVYVHFNVVGLETAQSFQDKGDLQLQIGERIMDSEGKEIFNNPNATGAKLSDTGAKYAAVNLDLKCHKSGKFKVEITAGLLKGKVNISTQRTLEFEVKE